MFFRVTTEKNARYLKPIFSDFEKEYLLSELDMIIKNGGDIFKFDSLETNRFSVYLKVGHSFFIGFCSGTLSNVLWTLLTTKLIDEEIYYGSYLDFAINGSSEEPQTGHMTLYLDSNKIKQFFLKEDLFGLITENHSNSSKRFIEIIENVNRACNCEQIMLSVHPNGDCTANVSSTETTTTTVKTKETNDMPAYMPEGFTYLDGAIESKDYHIADEEGNIFTWVPERTLMDGRLVKGFFVSTYEISKGANGVPKSIEGAMPWVNISMPKAIEQAAKLGGRLLDGSEWNAICEECAEIVGMFKVYGDSTGIGNYWNSTGSTQTLEKTGKHVICGISNLAGNCWIWTNETDGKFAAIRGGSYNSFGDNNPMASSNYNYLYSSGNDIGFRIVL